MALLLVPNPIREPFVPEVGNRITNVGTPGQDNFGVGALLPVDIGFDALFQPIHRPSGSFM
jgi:hypothetical protein